MIILLAPLVGLIYRLGEGGGRRQNRLPPNSCFGHPKRSRSLEHHGIAGFVEMHRVIVPRYSGVHRFACMLHLSRTQNLHFLILLTGLALYRALLRQCAGLPEAALDVTAVRTLVQQKFHRYRGLQSPSQTSNAMKAGCEVFATCPYLVVCRY